MRGSLNCRRRRWRQCRRGSHTFKLIFLSDYLDHVLCFTVLQPEEHRQSDGKEGDCVWVGDHLQTKHWDQADYCGGWPLTRLSRWRVLAASQSQGRVGQVKLCSLNPSAKWKSTFYQSCRGVGTELQGWKPNWRVKTFFIVVWQGGGEPGHRPLFLQGEQQRGRLEAPASFLLGQEGISCHSANWIGGLTEFRT